MSEQHLAAIDWQQLVYAETFLKNAERLARKRLCNETLEAECVTYVLEELSNDDWRRCKAYKGIAKPSTFLYSLTANLVEQFARVKFGRPRPPTWVKQKGELWVEIWKQLCLERLLEPTVVDNFANKSGHSAEFIAEVIRELKARIPSCGQPGFSECSTANITRSVDASGQRSEIPSPALRFEGQALQIYRIMLASVVADSDQSSTNSHAAIVHNETAYSERVHRETVDSETVDSQIGQATAFATDNALSAKLALLQTSLKLSDQELVLLRMIYVDAVPKSTAAKALGLPPHQGGRIVESAFKRIRHGMQACGLELSEFLDG